MSKGRVGVKEETRVKNGGQGENLKKREKTMALRCQPNARALPNHR